MAKIKNVRVHAIYYFNYGYYWGTTYFKTFIDDNGNKTFFVNGKEVDGETGNKRFLEIYNSNAEYNKKKNKDAKDTFEVSTSEEEVTYEELIARCEKGIDEYVEYIEDYRQYKEACEHNAKLRKEIAKYRKLIEERGV
jgi:hypothetical protein